MLFEALISVFFKLLKSLILILPKIDGSLPSEFLTLFSNVVVSVAYFLPLKVLFPLLIMSFSLDFFAIIWKIILRIKSFIPFMGD